MFPFRSLTVASAVGMFTRAIAHLEAVAEHHYSRSQLVALQAAKLMETGSEHAHEAQQARVLIGKLKQLVEA